MGKLWRVFCCLMLVALLAVGAGLLYARRAADSFSARAQPSAAEALLAGAARDAATPSAVRNRANPIRSTPEVLQAGMAHYADHCAVCHGNNGAGQTMLGTGMYPKPPDMRRSGTQSKTDGELFSIIENGVRLSGMPAFSGGRDTESESWQLVAFLRHLPGLTEPEEQTMEHLNPKAPGELEEEKSEANFLNGTVTAETPRRKTQQGTAHRHLQ